MKPALMEKNTLTPTLSPLHILLLHTLLTHWCASLTRYHPPPLLPTHWCASLTWYHLLPLRLSLLLSHPFQRGGVVSIPQPSTPPLPPYPVLFRGRILCELVEATPYPNLRSIDILILILISPPPVCTYMRLRAKHPIVGPMCG